MHFSNLNIHQSIAVMILFKPHAQLFKRTTDQGSTYRLLVETLVDSEGYVEAGSEIISHEPQTNSEGLTFFRIKVMAQMVDSGAAQCIKTLTHYVELAPLEFPDACSLIEVSFNTLAVNGPTGRGVVHLGDATEEIQKPGVMIG
jgi:hypothetical protein